MADMSAEITPMILTFNEEDNIGRTLRATLIPPRDVPCRIAAARFCGEGNGHVVSAQGPERGRAAPNDHDDRKSLARRFWRQAGYADGGARLGVQIEAEA